MSLHLFPLSQAHLHLITDQALERPKSAITYAIRKSPSSSGLTIPDLLVTVDLVMHFGNTQFSLRSPINSDSKGCLKSG